MKLKSLGYTNGRVISVDDEIHIIEQMMDAGRVEHIVSICLEKKAAGLYEVHTGTMGAPLPVVREMLKMSLKAIDDMIGKEQ